jgi:dolichyl-diphosphooligosaccharide---protein glycosyltransferase
MIGLHVGILVLTGRHTSKLHRAYSVFYVVGTIGALQVPVVGWRPLQSMEQLGPMAIFIFIQIMELVPVVRTYYSKQLSEDQFWHTNVKRFSFACSIFVVIMSTLLRIVNSGSLSARVRSLFITHTRTGNPLVDSVAEHQRTNLIAFIQFFHTTFMLIPVGFILCFFVKRTDAVIFQGTYLLVSCYFSTKMVRLILLLAQPASIAASMATISITTWALDHAISDEDVENSNYVITSTKLQRRKTLPMQKGEKKGMKKSGRIVKELDAMFGDQSKSAKKMIARILIAVLSIGFYNFISHSFRMAEHLSEPRVMFQRRESDGSVTTIDDFREAYWWLRDETPEDSRVLAWWDYGYQINGIANRTTLADGNTWNHEHIALIGKMLVSNEVEAHGMIKHLADYVLVMTTQWGGMWGDDLTKMPHMAKVAGSVYDDVDGLGYYFDKDHQPSALMRESLLYMLHGSRLDPDIIQPKHFSEVYTSRNKMVRIYEVKQVSEGSKSYSLKHRSYPPALTSVLRRKKNFNSAAYERL